MAPRRNAILLPPCSSIDGTRSKRSIGSRTVAIFLVAVVGCGGNVNATNGQPKDEATDAAVTDADPLAAAGLTLVSPTQYAGIQNTACAGPKSIDIALDSGVANCAFLAGDLNSSAGCGNGLWGCTDYIFTLRNGQRYQAHYTPDCSTGGVHPDTNNFDIVVLCPDTCVAVQQSGAVAFEVFELTHCTL